MLFILISLEASAEKFGCIGKDGKPYFSSSPCELVEKVNSQSSSSKALPVSEIRVMTAGYVDIQTINDKNKISEIIGFLNENKGPVEKGYKRQEYVLAIKSRTSKQSGYLIHEDGTIYYFSVMGRRVTEKYTIPNPEKLKALLEGE